MPIGKIITYSVRNYLGVLFVVSIKSLVYAEMAAFEGKKQNLHSSRPILRNLEYLPSWPTSAMYNHKIPRPIVLQTQS